jgi:hypothetical protein
MTRLQLRDKLRRRVNEEVGDADAGWTDAELNTELNEAYAFIQKEIYKIDHEAHLFWDLMAVTATVSWYPLPPTFGVSEFGMKSAASDTAFTRLDRKPYERIKNRTGTTHYYCQRGQWLGIFPAPSTTVADGLELVHTPIMSMSADTDIPRIKLPLHEAILLKAKISVLGDTGEDPAQARQNLADIINDLPSWYELNSDDQDKLSVEGL